MNNLLWLKKGNEQVPNRFSLILQTDLKQAGCTLTCTGRLVFAAVNLNYGPSPNTYKLPFMGKNIYASTGCFNEKQFREACMHRGGLQNSSKAFCSQGLLTSPVKCSRCLSKLPSPSVVPQPTVLPVHLGKVLPTHERKTAHITRLFAADQPSSLNQTPLGSELELGDSEQQHNF